MTGNRDFLVGKRVTVVGLGIEGVDVARFAVTHGAASVTVIDAKTPDALAGRMDELRGLPISYALGPYVTGSVAASDIVFASQSVPLTSPPLAETRERGIPLTSMMTEFLRRCPGPTVGITASSGKTTTTALVAHMFATDGRAYRAGGNMGIGLMGLLDGFDERTWAVLEISHNQLQLTDRSPHIAAILNITPNHLDQFSWEDYIALKHNIVRYQSADDYVVLGLDNELAAAAEKLTPAHVAHFSMTQDVPGDGAFVRDGAIFVRSDAIETMVMPVADIPLRGAHNVENALAAAAIAMFADIAPETIAAAIRSFQAVAHRLEFVGEAEGVRYVNDSIATTPERTLAGLRSFSEPVVLLLGGRDKHLPKEELADEALHRCTGIVFFGEDGPLLEAAIEAAAAGVAFEERPVMQRVVTLAEAVATAREMAEPGDVVLLSPACTSFDAYANFEARGEEFRALVRNMTKEGR